MTLEELEQIVATRAAVNTQANSLHVLEGGAGRRDALLVASEPLDADPLWRPVPDGSLLELTPEGLREMPLLDPSIP